MRVNKDAKAQPEDRGDEPRTARPLQPLAAEVLSGLEENDAVVVRPEDSIQDGTTVVPR